MKEFQEGDLCLRCEIVPIMDARMPYCSGCRKIVEGETEDSIRNRKNAKGKKDGFFTYLPNGKKRFSIMIPGMGKKHKK